MSSIGSGPGGAGDYHIISVSQEGAAKKSKAAGEKKAASEFDIKIQFSTAGEKGTQEIVIPQKLFVAREGAGKWRSFRKAASKLFGINKKKQFGDLVKKQLGLKDSKESEEVVTNFVNSLDDYISDTIQEQVKGKLEEFLTKESKAKGEVRTVKTMDEICQDLEPRVRFVSDSTFRMHRYTDPEYKKSSNEEFYRRNVTTSLQGQMKLVRQRVDLLNSFDQLNRMIEKREKALEGNIATFSSNGDFSLKALDDHVLGLNSEISKLKEELTVIHENIEKNKKLGAEFSTDELEKTEAAIEKNIGEYESELKELQGLEETLKQFDQEIEKNTTNIESLFTRGGKVLEEVLSKKESAENFEEASLDRYLESLEGFADSGHFSGAKLDSFKKTIVGKRGERESLGKAKAFYQSFAKSERSLGKEIEKLGSSVDHPTSSFRKFLLGGGSLDKELVSIQENLAELRDFVEDATEELPDALVGRLRDTLNGHQEALREVSAKVDNFVKNENIANFSADVDSRLKHVSGGTGRLEALMKNMETGESGKISLEMVGNRIRRGGREGNFEESFSKLYGEINEEIGQINQILANPIEELRGRAGEEVLGGLRKRRDSLSKGLEEVRMKKQNAQDVFSAESQTVSTNLMFLSNTAEKMISSLSVLQKTRVNPSFEELTKLIGNSADYNVLLNDIEKRLSGLSDAFPRQKGALREELNSIRENVDQNFNNIAERLIHTFVENTIEAGAEVYARAEDYLFDPVQIDNAASYDKLRLADEGLDIPDDPQFMEGFSRYMGRIAADEHGRFAPSSEAITGMVKLINSRRGLDSDRLSGRLEAGEDQVIDIEINLDQIQKFANYLKASGSRARPLMNRMASVYGSFKRVKELREGAAGKGHYELESLSREELTRLKKEVGEFRKVTQEFCKGFVEDPGISDSDLGNFREYMRDKALFFENVHNDLDDFITDLRSDDLESDLKEIGQKIKSAQANLEKAESAWSQELLATQQRTKENVQKKEKSESDQGDIPEQEEIAMSLDDFFIDDDDDDLSMFGEIETDTASSASELTEPSSPSFQTDSGGSDSDVSDLSSPEHSRLQRPANEKEEASKKSAAAKPTSRSRFGGFLSGARSRAKKAFEGAKESAEKLKRDANKAFEEVRSSGEELLSSSKKAMRAKVDALNPDFISEGVASSRNLKALQEGLSKIEDQISTLRGSLAQHRQQLSRAKARRESNAGDLAELEAATPKTRKEAAENAEDIATIAFEIKVQDEEIKRLEESIRKESEQMVSILKPHYSFLSSVNKSALSVKNLVGATFRSGGRGIRVRRMDVETFRRCSSLSFELRRALKVGEDHLNQSRIPTTETMGFLLGPIVGSQGLDSLNITFPSNAPPVVSCDSEQLGTQIGAAAVRRMCSQFAGMIYDTISKMDPEEQNEISFRMKRPGASFQPKVGDMDLTKDEVEGEEVDIMRRVLTPVITDYFGVAGVALRDRSRLSEGFRKTGVEGIESNCRRMAKRGLSEALKQEVENLVVVVGEDVANIDFSGFIEEMTSDAFIDSLFPRDFAFIRSLRINEEERETLSMSQGMGEMTLLNSGHEVARLREQIADLNRDQAAIQREIKVRDQARNSSG